MKTPENSWIIVEIETNKAVCEIHATGSTIKKLNPKYMAMRPSQWLPTLNKEKL